MLLASFSIEAQIVNIPDANFKAKLLEASPSNTIAQNNSNQNIKIDINDDGEIQENEALLVRKLDVSNASISSLEGILSFTDIHEINASYNNLSSVNFYNLIDLSRIKLNNNNFVSFDVILVFNGMNYGMLHELDLSNNPISYFNFDFTLTYPYFYIGKLKLNNTNFNELNIDLRGTDIIEIQNNQFLTEINFSNSFAMGLGELYIYNNPLLNSIIWTSTSVSYEHEYFFIDNNPSLSSVILDFDSASYINTLSIHNSPLDTLLIRNADIFQIELVNTNLETLDLSSHINDLIFLVLNNNLNLKFINLKTGVNYNNSKPFLFNFLNVPLLEYICVNEWELDAIEYELSFYPNINFNTYCSFVPGGEFYTIQGNTKLDLENNVCDENDIDFPNMKFNITNGSVSGNIISNTSGDYSIPVQAGTHTITPVFENPTYFNVSPPNVAVTFPAQISPFTQNFCVTPNGVHQDVEVVIVPLDAARPGFDATYKLVYKNKGNTTVSSSISLTYMDNVMDFLEANPVQSSVEPNILTWNYTNMQPFETRYITVSFNLNSPQETPALNGGDVLNFTAIIDPISGDEMVSDNTSTLNQEVVNSYDPNDKTCLEGSVISTELIGQYVHYVIRFENTGTFFAQNVVVKDEIDVSKFDLNSLIVLSTSHQQWTRINGNKVEFIFENIQLPFPPSEERHGYIAFKIKLKNNLTVGDTFSNFASIYFDYNFPIITEPATTTIEALSNPDFEFSNFVKLYPNPASTTITIESQTINLKSVEIFNSLGQLIQAIPNDNNQLSIDVSNLSTGTYFVKVHSDKGVGVSKFVKQ